MINSMIIIMNVNKLINVFHVINNQINYMYVKI